MIPAILTELGIGALISMGLFFATWFFAVKYKNGAMADITWSYGFLFLVIFYAFSSEGWLPRQLVLCTMVAFWSLRLTFYLAKRTIKNLHKEDTRYKALRQESKIPEKAYFLWIFFCQALLQTLVTVPFVISCMDTHGAFRVTEVIAIMLFIPAFIGEAVADKQLSDFKKQSTEQNSVCRVGLWNYSRHPNYFFEWLIWLAYFIYAVGSPYGLIALLSPVVMLQMLLNVSGVKFSESVSVGTRGEDYMRYQKETSAFIPWFPKRSS